MVDDVIIYFPCTNLAESKALDAGDILNQLQNIPLADLCKMDLRFKETHEQITGHEVIMCLAKGFAELAKAMISYQIAQAEKPKAAIEETA